MPSELDTTFELEPEYNEDENPEDVFMISDYLEEEDDDSNYVLTRTGTRIVNYEDDE